MLTSWRRLFYPLRTHSVLNRSLPVRIYSEIPGVVEYKTLFEKERKDHHKCLKDTATSIAKLNHTNRMFGAILGRSTIDTIYVKKVKHFMKEKVHGQRYSSTDLLNGYVAYFATDDPFAMKVKKQFKDLTTEETAGKIIKIYKKLSVTHRSVMSFMVYALSAKELSDVIESIPAIVSDDEIEFVNKITSIYVQTDLQTHFDEQEESIFGDVRSLDAYYLTE